MRGLSLLVVFLLTACGLGAPAAPTPEVSPTAPPGGAEQVAATFLSAWERADYAGMYGLLSVRSQQLVALDDFSAQYRALGEDALITGVHPVVRNALQQGARAQVSFDATFTTRFTGPFTRTGTLMPLVYADARWTVVWSSAVIMPELAGDNRIVFTARHPGRGNLYARDGSALAADGTVTTIGVIPGQITDEASVLDLLAVVLATPADELQARWAGAGADWFVPLGDVPQDVVQAYYERLTSADGVVLRSKSTRFYRDGGLAPHLIGYTGPIPAAEAEAYHQQGYGPDDRVGLSGLEALEESTLAGTFGGAVNIVTAQGALVTTLAERAAAPAHSVYTTIDPVLQAAAQDVLRGPIEGQPVRGVVIALDPQSGAILAMASAPGFDPNWFDPSSGHGGDLVALLNDPAQPLLDRATLGVYPPGSVFKIVSMAAALESGQYTPESMYVCTGAWNRLGPGWEKTDWKPDGHGAITLKQGLTDSCDPYFYDIGFTLDQHDADLLPSYARWFGLGALTGLSEVPETAGLVPDAAWKQENVSEPWYPGDSVNLAIGQGYLLVTPLQIARFVAAVQNGGTLYRPYVVAYRAALGGQPEARTEPEVMAQLPVKPENLEAIREALHDVTVAEGGTARHRFLDFPIAVAGKTGTAQNAGELPHAWFAGYTLANDPAHPDITLIVLVENSGEGSAVAAPLFRRIVERYFGLPEAPLPWEQP